MTRREALAGAALLGAGVGVGVGVDRTIESGSATPGTPSGRPLGSVPFHGPHQAGIATPMQAHMLFAAFDLTTAADRGRPGPAAARLASLLRRWSAAAATLAAGEPYPSGSEDPGEAVGLPPSGLTLTFGLGPAVFDGRFGLAGRKPPALVALPPFAGEDLDPSHSNGDLCVQACANDPQVAFHAVHVLARVAGSDATLRWAQTGFRAGAESLPDRESRRNLIGFKDGTDNLPLGDRAALERYVWAQPGDGPAWMQGGTYLIARRIQITLSGWDALTVPAQELTIGRHKLTGAPLGGNRESDPVDLAAKDPSGQPLIPLDAHIRVASPASNRGRRILRRGYSFSRGVTSGSSAPELDGGLFFIAFVRNPAKQFIPLQRRLSTGDALSAFTQHTASAIFAIPPGARRGGFVGEGLFA